MLTENLDLREEPEAIFFVAELARLDCGEQVIGQQLNNFLVEVAVPTGRTRLNGIVFYPEYRFHGEKLAELDSVGYQRYLSVLDNDQNQSPGMSMT